jgi:hypothetical protein
MTDDVDAKHENYPKFKNVRNKLNLLKTFISPDDLVLFSFSGHGISNEMGKGYLVMADSYIVPDRKASNCIQRNDLGNHKRVGNSGKFSLLTIA